MSRRTDQCNKKQSSKAQYPRVGSESEGKVEDSELMTLTLLDQRYDSVRGSSICS